MAISFLDFVNKRKHINESKLSGDKSLDNLVEKINNILKKHIKNLLPLVGYAKISDGKNTYMSKQYIIMNKPGNELMFQINWTSSKTEKLVLYSIDFFNNLDILYGGKTKSNLTIYTLGSSIVYFLPIIWTVINSKDFKLSENEAIALGRKVFDKSSKVKESLYYIGALKYRVFENMDYDFISDIYELNETSAEEFKQSKKKELDDAYWKRKDSEEDSENYDRLNSEYDEITKAIRGGATTIEELKLAIKHNVNLIDELDQVTKKAQEEFETEKNSPEKVFKMMHNYIKMVIKGINPSVILCGAPGVGKTYNVLKQLKENGYENGKNMFIIKGKCSPRQLYLRLFEYQKKGQIIVIDDADSLVGPKAPEDCINILKAALDSSSDPDGRLVSYGVSGKILDDEGNPIPKHFYYNGGVIVITNYNVGSLDTALRGRSYLQDINFSTEQLLDIVKSIMPNIDSQHLSTKSKIKSYDYMKELLDKGEEIEISIRTFKICAQIFESLDSEDDEDIAKLMIKEQLKLQAAREKNKKY